MSSLKVLLLSAVMLVSCAGAVVAHPHILAVADGRVIDFSELLSELEDTRVLFVGEQHDHPGHHAMQLELIRALHPRAPLAIGLEMFQAQDQDELNRWTAGQTDVSAFRQIYQQNWGWWSLYEPIFSYARRYGIPMVGLNLPRSITQQVAHSGFSSLDQEQLDFLGGITCSVDVSYEDFIRRALGAHGHGSFDFRNFCEAQLVWDKAMARYLVEYLERHPDRRVVVLAGSGHAWKYGIPAQIEALGYRNYRVLLPEIDGRLTRSQATPLDTDYLWLNEGEGSWTTSGADN